MLLAAAVGRSSAQMTRAHTSVPASQRRYVSTATPGFLGVADDYIDANPVTQLASLLQ